MRHLLLITSLLLTACGASGSHPDGPGTQAGAGSNMECHEERSPGSTVPREVCTPKAQADKNGDQLMNAPTAPPPATGVGGH